MQESACGRCHGLWLSLAFLSFDEFLERCEYLRVPPTLLDLILRNVKGRGRRKRWFVRPLGAQSIVDIHDLQHSGGGRNLFSLESVWIPGAIHLLMMMTNDRQHQLKGF